MYNFGRILLVKHSRRTLYLVEYVCFESISHFTDIKKIVTTVSIRVY